MQQCWKQQLDRPDAGASLQKAFTPNSDGTSLSRLGGLIDRDFGRAVYTHLRGS